MMYREIPALLRAEAGAAAFSQSHQPAPKPGISFRYSASRFERLAAAAEALPRWPALLKILVGAAAPGSWGGREVLWPLWADEAVHRVHCMVDLTQRLERQVMRRENRVAWSASCLAKAETLAASFAELQIVDEQQVLLCRRPLGEIAVGLLQLFKVTDSDVEARIVLDDLALPAYKRRALVLVASALVMQAITDAFERGFAPAVSIKLAAQGSGQWRLAVTADVAVSADDDARECDDIVDGLADLLEAQNVRRSRRVSKLVTEIDFPVIEVAPSVLAKASRVTRAVAWAHA
jgi:hypothetical protein